MTLDNETFSFIECFVPLTLPTCVCGSQNLEKVSTTSCIVVTMKGMRLSYKLQYIKLQNFCRLIIHVINKYYFY